MTIEEIKNEIIESVRDNDDLNTLDSTSLVAIYNLWAYVIAFIAWTQFEAWRIFKLEIDEQVRVQKRFTLPWFRDAALEFRFGHPLDDEIGEYTGEGYTEEQIQESKIVSRSSAIELEINNRKILFIKVAKDDPNGDLTALTSDELESLQQYFVRIKPAGTKIVITSGEADTLRLSIDFYYDPLILDENGVRIDGTDNEPVQDAIRGYLKNLKFNGEFNLTELVNRLESVDGCSDEAYVRNAESSFLNPPEFNQITSNYIANSGYMTISDEDLQINFISKKVAL